MFALHGFDGVSLREITAEAEVDLALVNYHFSTKERLYRTIIARRAQVISRARLRALREHGRTPTIEQIVEAFIDPLVKRLRMRDTGWNYYSALIGQISYSKKFVDFQHEHLDPTAEIFIDAFSRASPGSDVPTAYWAYTFMIGSLAQLLVGADRLKLLSDGRSDVNDMDRAYEKLKLYAAGGIRVAFAA